MSVEKNITQKNSLKVVPKNAEFISSNSGYIIIFNKLSYNQNLMRGL